MLKVETIAPAQRMLKLSFQIPTTMDYGTIGYIKRMLIFYMQTLKIKVGMLVDTIAFQLQAFPNLRALIFLGSRCFPHIAG